ncbi:TetR/AcrR family transcriptional regulator [Desulfovibrio ferrophilus]|uniref:Transcriptional regulator, TetR family n=1 Tax=Desulfovibrio ferrophilus TaxID=241368 RepID=A0A2Z6AWC9_9BACT|nr:TetR/AcrR family transcriptional regulator [Desulfovibrio ferrophilus]BBD07520.1 transcriptional regulator, TetR family [Desulfovibrio ferrophilus]
MTLPRKLRKDKREAIVTAAAAEVLERGYQGSSMDRIAQRAKVSKRTVYNHFGSKDVLFRTVIGEHWEQAQQAIAVDYDPTISLRVQLLELGRREAGLLMDTEFMGLTRAVLSECIRSPEWAETMFTDMKKVESGIHILLSQMVADGKLDIADIDFAAHQYLGMIKGFLFWPRIIGWNPDPGPEECERVVAAAVDMFIAYYRS